MPVNLSVVIDSLCYMLVFWYFVLENTAPPVVEPPENGGFVLMKHFIPKVGIMKTIRDLS